LFAVVICKTVFTVVLSDTFSVLLQNCLYAHAAVPQEETSEPQPSKLLWDRQVFTFVSVSFWLHDSHEGQWHFVYNNFIARVI
jgi:hypothetical protein